MATESQMIHLKYQMIKMRRRGRHSNTFVIYLTKLIFFFFFKWFFFFFLTQSEINSFGFMKLQSPFLATQWNCIFLERGKRQSSLKDDQRGTLEMLGLFPVLMKALVAQHFLNYGRSGKMFSDTLIIFSKSLKNFKKLLKKTFIYRTEFLFLFLRI